MPSCSHSRSHFVPLTVACALQYSNPADHCIAALSHVPSRPAESAKQIRALLEMWNSGAGAGAGAGTGKRSVEDSIDRINEQQQAARAGLGDSAAADKVRVRALSLRVLIWVLRLLCRVPA